MIKYITATELLDKKNQWDDASGGLKKNLKDLEKEFTIIINYNHSGDRAFKKEALGIGTAMGQIEILIHDDNLGRGGGGGDIYGLFLAIGEATQPYVMFTLQAGASAVIGKVVLKMIKNAGEQIIALFKKSKRNNGFPPYVSVLGKNNSELQFHFFAYFKDKDVTKAWSKIPDITGGRQFKKNKIRAYIFDLKENIWHLFEEGNRET